MKKRKKWLIGLGVLILLAAAGIWGAERYLKERIREELQVQTAYGDTLRISKVDLGLLGGWMNINDLVIRWNIDQQQSPDQPTTILIQGQIGKIELKGLSFFKYLTQRKIFIRELVIQPSSLDLHHLNKARNKLPPVDSSKKDNSLFIDIAGIRIKPSKLRYYKNGEKEADLEIGRLSVDMDGFHYPQVEEDSKLIKFLSWSAEELRYGQPEQFSDLLVGKAGGNSTDSSFLFSELRFLPRYSKADYSRLLKHKNSRVDIVVSRGSFQGMNWVDLLTTGKLRARSFDMDSCIIEVYEDSNLPVNENRYKSLYQEKLLATEMGIEVDTVRVNSGRLRYEIKPKAPGGELGYLEFRNLNATMTHVTNDSTAIARDPLLRVNINSVLNGESKLTTYFTFDLSSPTAAFDYSGEMHGFDLPKFNTILMETSRMKIAQGQMQRMAFQVHADKQLAQGEMRIDFSDLKIEWLEQHNRLAALAQKVIMLEQNPKNGKYRVGQIYFERLPYRSFWNYYVKSLLSGLNSTAVPNIFLPKELESKKEKK